MGRLTDITLEELHEQLERTEGNVPTRRVMTAIERKRGTELEYLAESQNVCEKTIRNWLDRFAEQPIEQAPYDDPRPGGPSKLASDQRDELFDNLQNSPTELGYDRQAWSPPLLLHHVTEEYGVAYTKRHAGYLLNEAGLSWRTARPRNHEADPEKEAEFKRTVEKNDQP